jgi:integrase/recombinase XerD
MLDLPTYADEFLAEKERENLSRNTLNHYETSIRKFLEHLAVESGADGDLRPEEITPQHLRVYATCIQQQLSPGGVHARLRPLRVFFNWLVDEEAIDRSPLKTVRFPKVPAKRLPAVSTTDFCRLMRAAGETELPLRNKAILLTLFDTGLRASELLGLRLEDVLPKGLLHVVNGKGAKSRVVPVSRKVTKAIHAYVRSERSDCSLSQLLLNRQGEALTRSGVLSLIKGLCSAAGTAAYSPHAFRRGFVVTYLIREGDPFSAKRILGHTTMAMVDRYAAMGVEDLKQIHLRASPVSGLS